MLCARCHGLDGKGEGLRTLERYPDFTQAAWQQRVSDTHIEAVVRKGGAALGLNAQMPSWEGVLMPAELGLMVQKIRSFGPDNGQSQ
jgi:mono/diheme cytochrome c family protein